MARTIATSFALIVGVLTLCCSERTPVPAPHAEDPEATFQKKRVCAEAGYRLLEDLRHYYSTEEQAGVYRPVFAYSDKLNTCVCRFSVVFPNHRVEDWIYDSLSGRDLGAYFADTSGHQASKMSKTEFQTKERELFGQSRE